MNVKITNLGLVQNAEINIDKKFTVFTGKNNTGKSYLNYLLYGLYRIDEDKLVNQLYPLITKQIKVEVNDNERVIILSIDIYAFILAQLENIFGIYASILQENISNLFATKELNPGIKLAVTRIDKTLLSKLKLLKVNVGNFHYTYEDLDQRSGHFSLEGGNLFYKTATIETRLYKNKGWKSDFIEEVKKAMVVNTVLEILRFLKGIVSFPNNHPANSSVYFFSAERSAINLFYEDIIQSKAKKGDDLSRIITYDEFIKYKKSSAVSFNYPQPINDYLYYVDYLGKLNKQKSEIDSLVPDLERLIGGKIVLGEFDEMKFVPDQSNINLDLHISSSTVKSFAGLVFYFTHLAKKGDTIFIDEPELNLHPDNQRLIVRILAKALNAGIKIFISTHSDYIVRELNNLIMLKQDSEKSKELRHKYGYSEDELLSFSEMGVYVCGDNQVYPVELTDTGFEIETIDAEINLLNQSSQDIFFSLYD